MDKINHENTRWNNCGNEEHREVIDGAIYH